MSERAVIMAGKTKKGGGPRVVIDWGQITVKKKGKKVAKKMSSRVLESTATLFGLKPSTVGGAVTKVLKTKKGNRVVISSPLITVARRKIFASTDGKTWHSIPVPSGLTLAKAFMALRDLPWYLSTSSIVRIR